MLKDEIVNRLLARVGKEPVLPRLPGERKGDIYAASVVADKQLFTKAASLGASVEADDRQAKRGRVKTVQFNPREGSTTMGGVPAHRGNLDYQDVRKTLVDGYEDDPRAVDSLRTNADEGSRRAPEPNVDQILKRMDCSLRRSVPVLWAGFHQQTASRGICFTEVDSCSEMPLRVCSLLQTYFDEADKRSLACLKSAAAFEAIPRRGAAEIPRIGDRYVSGTVQWMRKNIVDCIIEGIRSGIQTSFYVCDYSTKPNMTCAPLLKHMAQGMQNLEATMKEEEAQMKLNELLGKGLLHGKGLTAQSTSNNPPSALPPVSKRPMPSAERDEARRRLIRLWSSANNAVVKGCCLMAIQLLTGREVIRTHRHWRILMKRPIWSAHEALRQVESGIYSKPPPEEHRLSLLTAPQGQKENQVSGSQKDVDIDSVDVLVARNDPVEAEEHTVNLTNDAFYDGWLHRGREQVLRNMNLYVYAMYVLKTPRLEAMTKGLHAFEFDEHYVQAQTFVQVLLEAPRTPFLHGVTMPTRAKLPATNALVHQILLRPTRCPGRCHCNDVVAHSGKYLARSLQHLPASLHGVSRPRRTPSKAMHGAERFLQPWRAYEAEL